MFRGLMYILIGTAMWVVVQPESDAVARILAIIQASFSGMAIGVTWAEDVEEKERTENKRKYTKLRDKEDE